MHVRRGDKVALYKAGKGYNLKSFNRGLTEYMLTAQKLAKRSGSGHGHVYAAKLHAHAHAEHTYAYEQ